MDIKRFATFIFDGFVWLVFTTLLILFLIGMYMGIKAEEKPEAVEYIKPVEVVEPTTVTTTDEESEVVLLSCSSVEEVEPVTIEVEYVWNEPEYTEADLENLALVIYQEAGSDVCSDETRMMVGNVVLNRVADERFPNTIEEVLLQERQYGMLHWTGLVWPERASYLSEAHAVQRAYDCAERLLNGERLLPDDVVFQAEFGQGTEIVVQQDGFYFCR